MELLRNLLGSDARSIRLGAGSCNSTTGKREDQDFMCELSNQIKVFSIRVKGGMSRTRASFGIALSTQFKSLSLLFDLPNPV